MACAFALAASLGCRHGGADCRAQPPLAGQEVVCQVPGWPGRDYLVRLPPRYDPAAPTPLVLAFHGGGGRKEGMNSLTCAEGHEASPHCLSAVADQEGFIVAYPDGTSNGLGFRSWNHGGDHPDLQCPHACAEGVDDMTYFDALLEDLMAIAAVDPARVYATGFSNGAGLAHRLACERAERLAAIAPVGGANQFAAGAPCEPGRPVPVLQIHGREDPCWPYAGGEGTCLSVQEGAYAGVEASLFGAAGDLGWARRNGCATGVERSELEDPVEDGTRATLTRALDCAAETALITVEGGGHTWPGGDLYLSERRIGRRSRDFSASAKIWSFFQRQRR